MTEQPIGLTEDEVNAVPYKMGTDYESLKRWLFSVLGESKESFSVFTSYEVLYPGFLAKLKEHKDRSEIACKSKFKNSSDGGDIVFNVPNRFKR